MLPSVLVSKKVVLENVILKIQLGKSSSMSKFLSRWGINRECHLLFDGFVVFWIRWSDYSKPNGIVYPVEMRLKVKNGINNCSIIDDSYSSDFQSLKIALDFLESQKI
jgi:alanine racemase